MVSLGATPAVGSALASWSQACTGNGACRITMTSNESVTAAFGASTFNLDISAGGNGSGTITVNPLGASCGTGCYTYNWGTVVSVTATAGGGSVFTGWAGACSNSAGFCTVTMTLNQSVTAMFAPLTP